MPYKTIVAYFPRPERVSQVLAAALPLARRHDAHLIGVTAIPPVHMYAALAGEVAASLIETELEAFRRDAEKAEAAFQRLTHDEGVSVEWRCLDSSTLGIAATLAELAASADIVVASQPDPSEMRAAVPQGLVTECARPVLILPHGHEGGEIGRRILVGWNGRSEASRAVFGALEILRKAEHVEIATVCGPEEFEDEAFSPADDIAATLARHGVAVETIRIPDEGGSEGELLLDRAVEQKFDLLVIGAYGHSRLSELVFGGVTRYMLQSMTVPVLMAH